ncbi:MAG TPA: SBBP repeat-containing protein [Kofleriaceae bacterium]|nr:SBBP repeat-containing protein [Kofleriaceae bacterium]
MPHAAAPLRHAPLALLLLAALPGCKDQKKEATGGGDQPAPAVPAPRGQVAPSGAGAIGKAGGEAPPLPPDPGGKGGVHAWSIRFGGTQADSGRRVAAAPDGHLFAVGTVQEKAAFGDAISLESEGMDGFLARLGPDGAVQWALRMGGEGQDIASDVAVDPRGNAVVTGWFATSLELGDGALKSAGSDDLFVAAIDPQGRRVWAHRFGGPDSDGGDGVAVDASGNIAVIGSYRSEIDVGKQGFVAGGSTDVLLIVLDARGELKWARTFGSIGPDEGRAVGFDQSGNLYALVEFSRAVDFGGGPLTSAGNRDMAVVKLAPDGTHLWSRRFGSQLDELAVGLAVDPSGSVLLTGSFDDVLDLGAGEPMRTAGRSDVFVAKLGPDGATRWARQLGDTDEDIGADITSDAFGNVYVTGWYWKTLRHGAEALTSAGKKDAFLIAMSPDGQPLWGKRFGGAEDDYGRGVAAGTDAVHLIGTYHVAIDLGGGELTAAKAERASIPYGDVFVATWTR